MNNLILNSSNVSGNSKSTYSYNFLKGGFTINEDAYICVNQITIPYSWFNISKNYGNNTFSYTWQGATLKTFIVVYPDGFYTLTDINNYLEQFMISNNHYLISNTGQYLFYIQFLTNVTYYANQILTFPLPTSLPANYTEPSGGFNKTFGYASIAYTPQIIIANYTSNASIGAILGFLPNTYPSTLSLLSQSIKSNITPNLTPVNSVIIMCSKCINNSNPSTVLDSFTINASFGNNITYTPSIQKWIRLIEGVYTTISLSFVDQNFNTIYCNDSNILISLLLKNGLKIEKKPLPFISQIKSINKLSFE